MRLPRLQHVASQQLRRLSRRYPFLRRLSITTNILTLIWFYTLYWGERSVYKTGIETCDWKKWEQWPQEAAPHHLVFIADPQLVDPHTYPGRPWPLSTFTEQYTDLYMTRNFRLINERLDPDTIIFLGDLFDGGREWAPGKARKLKSSQRKRLQELGIVGPKEEQSDGKEAQSLKEFVPGENGRWSKWGAKQWDRDFERFGKIFFAPEQLYPVSERKLFAAYDVPPEPASVENGADDVTWQEYATTGGKPRRVIASLPGNHDLGFGSGVQLAVRDRFQSHFGESNRMDVIGNHTFLSLDVLSLSAHSFYQKTGYETEPDQIGEWKYIWKQSWDFIRDLRAPAGKVVSEALSEYYPKERTVRGWRHEVTEPEDRSQQPSISELAKEAMQSKPQLPVILLSHVPLFRHPDTECGHLRERGHAIPIAMGYQYQNVLTHTLSKEIAIKAFAAGDVVGIFSGDDHDYCDVIHRYNIPTWTDNPDPGEANLKAMLKHVREISVKSFSWAMGVRKPGFLLVSLWNPVDAEGNTIGTPLPTVQTHLCLLPDQLGIFIDYGLYFILTIPVLLFHAVILSLRSDDSTDAEENPLSPMRMSLPHFQMKSNGTSNGFSHPGATAESKGRQRASSTSTSHSRNNSGYLGVQRSYNARTRSVSPAIGSGTSMNAAKPPVAPLIDKAGYFPQVKWTDPADDDSDEEPNIGAETEWKDDSQAKWKWRRRTPNRTRRVLDEFGISLLVVGVPGALWYAFLVKNG